VDAHLVVHHQGTDPAEVRQGIDLYFYLFKWTSLHLRMKSVPFCR
jgi:hypothetical protein